MNRSINHQMNPQQWQAAEAIAQAVQSHRIDVNEMKKVVSYLRWWQGRQGRQGDSGGDGLGNHLVNYVEQLAASGEVRSQRTQEYYRALARICQENLELFTREPEAVIPVLGWAVRLAVYYNNV
jgi:hypothetical protein